jgi:hypothetical protein
VIAPASPYAYKLDGATPGIGIAHTGSSSIGDSPTSYTLVTL